MQKIPVAILGATGAVGQRFMQLLDQHPWFEVVALTASDRSVGSLYGEARRWKLATPMPEWAHSLPLLPTEAGRLDVALAFSALPSSTALEVEGELARKGCFVCSNASAYRMEPDVPILLPEVNPEHIQLIEQQRTGRGWKAAVLTNSNCTSTGLTVAMKALDDAFGVKKAFVVSMQALSGAGYPGVPSLDIQDNIIPFIGDEEEKVETEPLKMLGKLNGHAIRLADIVISAHTNRVHVSDGHMVCTSLELEQKATPDEAKNALRSYQPPAVCDRLPSTPKPVIIVKEEDDRPQPRLDRELGKGMATIVGRVRPDTLLDLKMVVLSHNTIRGAAGGSVYNAELLVESGYLSR